MEKPMRCLAAVIFCIIIVAETEVNPKIIQEFEFTSAPGAPDLIEMLSEYDNPRNDWDTARRHMRTIKLYHGQVTQQTNPDLARMINGNTLERLAGTGSIRHISRNFEMKLAFEVGAMKEHNCLYSEYDLKRAVDFVVDSVEEIYRAGGVVH